MSGVTTSRSKTFQSLTMSFSCFAKVPMSRTALVHAVQSVRMPVSSMRPHGLPSLLELKALSKAFMERAEVRVSLTSSGSFASNSFATERKVSERWAECTTR
eukprot:3761324-Pyramimonas_sp.AAC.1